MNRALPPPSTMAWLRGVMETIANHGHELGNVPDVANRARGHASTIVAWLDELEREPGIVLTPLDDLHETFRAERWHGHDLAEVAVIPGPYEAAIAEARRRWVT